jgi:DNA-binding transcriptional MerR regulator
VDVNVPESMTPWIRGGAGEQSRAPAPQDLTVGEVAALVGVSVRTLHHWDSVGVVRPRGRTPGGYRAYSSGDVGRIHRVLVYRELGFSLSSIGPLLDDPTVDEVSQLRQQRKLLADRIGRLRAMAEAVDRVLAARAAGTTLSSQEQAEIFGRGWREDWAEEARDRWGGTEEWAQFERNASGFSEADRRRMHEGGEQLYAELAEAKRTGETPGGERANALAEQHRAMISQLFTCTHSMQVCLGQIYVSDERFATYFDEIEPGLADWMSHVIDENARRYGVDPAAAVWE